MSESDALFLHFNESFASRFSGSPCHAVKGGDSPRLDNRGSTLTPPSTIEEGKVLSSVVKRRRAWALRDTAAMLLRPEDEEKRGPAVCGCGRAGHNASDVAFHLNEHGAARTSGVLFCDSAWLCPVCAPRRAKERQVKVAEIYDVVWGLKGHTPMITITVRHDRKMSLLEVRAAVDAAYRKVRQGAPWAKAKKKYGIYGVLSAPEITWSQAHGWHYHIHIGIPCQTDLAGAQELGVWFLDRYLSYIRAEGFTALRKAQDVTIPASGDAAADYLAKGVTTSADATWELAGSATKRGKSDGMHPFDILEAAASGNEQMKALWREYAEGMKGVRSCVVTASMAEKLGLNEVDDIEKPGETPVEPEPIGSLPSDVWNAVMRKREGSTMLAVLEDGGAEAWPEARDMAYGIAGREYDPEIDDPLPLLVPAQIKRQHAPTPEEIAEKALAEAYQCRGRKNVAIGKVLDRERGVAVSKGLTFVPPDLRRVLELVAA